MMKLKIYFLLILQIILVKAVFAQPGANDGGFNTIDNCMYGDGPYGSIVTSVIQPDGKIIVGGDFTMFNGVTQNRIARLNTDGSLDVTFNSGTGFDGFRVQTISLQPDGKIIVGGSFSSYNGITRNRIARLNTDGSLDTTFYQGTGFDGNYVYSTSLQPDGKIIVGGDFTMFNGVTRNRIARLNADGSLDVSFNPGNGFSGTVFKTSLQADGKIVVGGYFSTFNGTAQNCISRLNTDGSLDATFNTGTGYNNYVFSTSIQPDGKIIVGGWFTSYNGTARNCISRLNADGSLDGSFNPGAGFNGFVNTTFLQSDGKIIVGGNFSLYNGTSRRGIVRLNADSALDVNFNPGSGFNYHVMTTSLQPDGKIIAGGAFSSYNDMSRRGIVRLNDDGSLDATFNPGTGFDGFNVLTTSIQPDGRIIVGGDFTMFNGVTQNRIVRLNADGSLDASFNSGTGFDGYSIYSTSLQSDGKIIVGGNFTMFNGTTRNRIVRLNVDGSLDVSFNPGSGFNGYNVYSTSLQPDGKIIVGGNFTMFNGVTRNRIVRLNADGSLDASFNPGIGFDGNNVTSTSLQPDGKILVVGDFTMFNGINRNRIVRLNTDGSIDNTFDIGSGLNGTARTTCIQPDGKILIGGIFTSFNGTACNRIVRLNTDGSIDNTFDIGSGFNSGVFSGVFSLTLEANGRIIAGGTFSSYDGNCRNRIARILNCYPSNSSINASACDEYTLNGQSYTTSGTYTQNLFSIGGCDSTVTLNLTITNSTSNNMVVSSCSSYTLNGQTYDSTGVYNQLLQNSSGCDSLITLNLTILQTTETNLNETSCGAFTLNDQTYINSGTYQQVLSNSYGCDSVITINLTVNTSPLMTITDNGDSTLSANSASSYQWINCGTNQPIVGANNQTILLTENGSYAVIGENAAGCVDTSDCVVVDYLSTTQHTLLNWSVYPNPTDDNVVVYFAGENMVLSIRDYQGKLLEKITVQPNTTISMNDFESGVYFFEMEWNGKVEIMKIVKL